MPELTVYHITPKSAFHFGTRGIEQETTGLHFPSDSLFAALLSTWLELGREPDELVRLFPRLLTDAAEVEAEAEGVPFLLTSMFPRAGQVRFYPALPLSWMLTSAKLEALHQEHRLKEIKKIQFISEELFKAVTGGQRLDEWVPSPKAPQATDQGLYLQKGALWLARTEVEQLPDSFTEQSGRNGKLEQALRQANVWSTVKVPRVTVDRLSNASQIFHTGRLQLNIGCGFWFGIAWRQPGISFDESGQTLQPAIHQILALLADSGIGAERNSGYGHFEYEKIEQPVLLPEPEPEGLFVTLSRYHPRAEEIGALQHEQVAYTLTPVSGWLSSPKEAAQRRRRLWLVAEGSVLQTPAGSVWGDIVDVRPQYDAATFPHPVWRYGLALPVGIGGKQ